MNAQIWKFFYFTFYFTEGYISAIALVFLRHLCAWFGSLLVQVLGCYSFSTYLGGGG